MYGDNSKKFRQSAFIPFAFSIIAFALVLVLVLSGTKPNSIPDGYLLSFNTTSVGQNLIEFKPAGTPLATPAVNAARDIHSALLRSITSRSMISNSTASNFTNPNSSISSSSNSDSSLSSSLNMNVSISSTSNPNSNSTNPTLVIPQTTVQANPAVIPISLVGTLFQLTLNTLATGMGQTLQGIISLLVTNGKQSLGVNQYYTMHLSGICEGSVLYANATNSSSPYNITRCISYEDAGTYIANLTSTVSDSTLIAATNITVPFMSKIPSIGKSAKSLIDIASGVVLTVFIITLIGNGLSILLSAAAFIQPTNAKIPTAAAAITTFSTQLLQISTIASTTIALSIRTAINSYSNVSGLSATVGGKFLALIWVGYIAAQVANGYWVATWFVEYRTTSYKARMRTEQEMKAGYKGIGREILSDLRLSEVVEEDTEVLIKGMPGARRLNGDYNQF